MTTATVLYVGTCDRGHTQRVPLLPGASRRWVTCPQCAADRAAAAHGTMIATRMLVAVLKGTVSERRECNAACVSARSKACVCACGGKNHASAYDATMILSGAR